MFIEWIVGGDVYYIVAKERKWREFYSFVDLLISLVWLFSMKNID